MHRIMNLVAASFLLALCGCGVPTTMPATLHEEMQSQPATIAQVPPKSEPPMSRPPVAHPGLNYDNCPGGTLDQGAPIGQQGPDLVIANMTCTVDGTHATYNFHNVYVLSGGTLTFSDKMMDFYAANILVQNNGVLQATGIGADNDRNILTIHLYGGADDPGVVCKKLSGTTLEDDNTCGIPANVWGSNVMSMDYPTSCVKTSDLNPPTKLPGDVDDCFYQYTGFDGDNPVAYFGHKVLALSYGGAVVMSGYKGAQGGNDGDPTVTGSSWMRLNATLQGNGTEDTLQVSGMPADWGENDKIVVTSTDYLPAHSEQLTIASVTGSTVKLNASTLVQNPHWGQTYSLKDVPCDAPAGTTDCTIGPALLSSDQDPNTRNIDMRAAVGLLSRSIRIVSDGQSAGSPLPTSGNPAYYGGHTIVRQGFLAYQIQGVEFYQLGQGGAKGHYPVHFHMARKVPTGTYVKDSSAWDSMTRWMTLHSTQGVTLARNVGYKSIGHGFYLEDGTETDNVLNTNLGVLARAAVQNTQNDRVVPGILAAPGNPTDPSQPVQSDWQNPTIFWIMNGQNDFQYNFASSAETCGVCYWDLPGGISGPSRKEYFEGYAGEQVPPTGFAGTAPLRKFVGNSCSTAMFSFLNIGTTGSCLGVTNNGSPQFLQAVNNTTAPVQVNPSINDPNYPYVTGLAQPTQCPGGECPTVTCGNGGPPPDLSNCVVTTLDRYTSSFNWAPKNFSAIWLRRWWFLVENSAITDVQQGGITFVTGGGYTRSELAQGYWSLLRTSALVGNTQATNGKPANAYAWSAGPFNPSGLTCDNQRSDFCLSAKQGIVYPFDFFQANQRLINIYDGPSHQQRNAFMDIPVSEIGSSSECTNNGIQQTCPSFNYLYGNQFGDPVDSDGECYLPNAAIAWKQSNGFYYPPAFHSDQLFFQNVAIRHFVIEPLFNYGTFTTDQDRIKKRYCTWKTDMFVNFTDIDRQTVLNDDDGSLTGLLADLGAPKTRETISVNRPLGEAGFFNDPKVTVECATDYHPDGSAATAPPGTANTSPNEYISTGIIAQCGINRGGCRQGGFSPPGGNCEIGARPPNQYCAWGNQCGAGSGPTACYGVPLYRQYLTDQEFTQYSRNPNGYNRPTVRMMGQGNGQRSTLTVNHGLYYIDDQVTLQTQQNANTSMWNIFMPNQTYYVYFIYAKPSLDQTYQMFVGYGLNKQTVESAVQPYRALFPSDAFQFSPASGSSFLDVTYDDRAQSNGGTGLVSVHVHLDAYASEFSGDVPKFCQPLTYCSPNGQSCECAAGTGCTDNSVCAWAVKDMDCPIKGCFAFGITMPGTFGTGVATMPPVPMKFSDDPNYQKNWQTPYELVDSETTGSQCHYTSQP